LYPDRRCPLSTSELQEVIFDLEHLTKLVGQMDRMMKCNTGRVMKHNPIIQGAMSPMHRRESA
jgi:hypothetical protein